MEPIVLNIAEAAALLSMTEKQLYNLTRPRSRDTQAAKIPVFRMGKRLMFRRESLETWVRQLEGGKL